MKIGVLCSQVRPEEKLIFRALEERRVDFKRIDVRSKMFDLRGDDYGDCDVVLLRDISHSRALYAAKILEGRGVRTVNRHRTIATCGDKIMTTIALFENGVPSPSAAVAFSAESALKAVERIGYPAVVKPPVGSWGRFIAKLNDRQGAEAVLEHKRALAGSQGCAFYIQDYVEKPGRDIRTLVIGDETVYAVHRCSEHWITNTARGGRATPLHVTPEIDRISRAAARAVDGEIVAVDILETVDGGLLVNEVNHTPEFHGAYTATGLDIAGRMVEYVLRVARSLPSARRAVAPHPNRAGGLAVEKEEGCFG